MNFTDRLYSIIGKRIRSARKDAKFTQRELSKQIGLTRTSITNMEYGQQKIHIHTIYAIAKALNVPVVDLLPEITMEGVKDAEDAIFDRRKVVGNAGTEGLTEAERERIVEILALNKND